MLINGIANQVLAIPELRPLVRAIDAGDDAGLSVAQSARTLMLAALWARNPRPCIYIVSGEEAADRAARAIGAWVGLQNVCRFPERRDQISGDNPFGVFDCNINQLVPMEQVGPTGYCAPYDTQMCRISRCDDYHPVYDPGY